MFAKTARFYDAFYDAAGKDYRRESAAVLERVRAVNPQASSLLDVACGTGRHLEQLSRDLRCVGVDLDPGLLRVARSRCPGVRFVEADMVSFSLAERFDAVTCLFSSVGYVRTADNLRRAVHCMTEHLAPGGVLLLEPSFRPDQWRTGHIDAVFVDQPELKAARISHSGREGDVAILDLHYLIGHAGLVEYLHERHELGLFTRQQYVEAMQGCGLRVEVDEDGPTGRGLVVGVEVADEGAPGTRGATG